MSTLRTPTSMGDARERERRSAMTAMPTVLLRPNSQHADGAHRNSPGVLGEQLWGNSPERDQRDFDRLARVNATGVREMCALSALDKSEIEALWSVVAKDPRCEQLTDPDRTASCSTTAAPSLRSDSFPLPFTGSIARSRSMPEGHTIHRLARDHTCDFAKQQVAVTSPQGRMADGAAMVDGQILRAVDPYGKHLFYRFAPVGLRARKVVGVDPRYTTIHVHLGLFGKFKRSAAPGETPRDTVRMRIVGEKWAVDLTGPTDCRIIEPDEEAVIRARLGPDPIRDDADPELAWARITKRKSTIGEALMDQKLIAGVGNVYRAESLFVHGIHPNRAANAVTRREFDALWSTIVRMLRQGVEDARIITVGDDELGMDGVPRRKIRSKEAVSVRSTSCAEAVYVYKKDHCRRCGTPILRWDLSGRWAYACPTCQPS